MVKVEVALRLVCCGQCGLRAVGLHLRRVEQRQHAAGGGKGRLHLRDHARDLVEGLHVLVGVAEEALHLAHGERAGHARDHADAAHDGHYGIGDVVDEARRGVGERAYELGALPHAAQFGVEAREGLDGAVAVAKGAHELLV